MSLYSNQQNIFTVTVELYNEEIQLDPKYVVSIEFNESIFSFCNHGKLIFHDVDGFIEQAPLTGNEKIRIIFGVEKHRERTFDIAKISKIVKSGSSTHQGFRTLLEIYFVDEFYFPSLQNRYSRSWSNTQTSTIIKEICENMIGIEHWNEFEESSNNIDFCSPYWSSLEMLRWIIPRSKGKNSNSSSYLLFNNNSKEDFLVSNLITLESLLSNNEFMRNNFLINVEEWLESHKYFLTNHAETNFSSYNQILSYIWNGIDKHSYNTLKGGVRFGYDSSRKKLLQTQHNYKDDTEELTMLGGKTLFTDISNPTTSYKNIGESNISSLDNIYMDKWTKSYCCQNTLNISVRGHETRYAGGLIEIPWPSVSPDEILNKNLQGIYLVSEVKHWFNSMSSYPYMQRLKLIKNAFDDSDHDKLVKSTKKNMFEGK